jgi:Mg2+-importing ATPase
MALERSVDGAGTAAPRVLALARVNSTLQTGLKSPLDEAILAAPDGMATDWQRVDEVPFDFERRRMSVAAANGGRPVLICKGAPESVLSACTRWESTDGVRPLDESARARCQDTERALAGQGLRVIAVASRPVGQKEPCGLDSERDLCLAGFLAFLDPPLPDTAKTVRALRRDGVAVKILSGDDPLVVRHVCERVGTAGAGDAR